MFLTGSAGTGKTFILLHLALKAVLDKGQPFDKVVLVRSLLPSRDIGFLAWYFGREVRPVSGSLQDSY